MSKKMIFIINGKGGSGKDTMIEGLIERGMKIKNISSIEPIKSILIKEGYWDGVEKTDKVRKCLSELKRVFEEYNQLCTIYVRSKVAAFESSDEDIMFIHIRETEDIWFTQKFINNKYPDIPVYTLFVYRKEVVDREYGNQSDDDASDYNYEYIFNNYSTEEESKIKFYELIDYIYKNR